MAELPSSIREIFGLAFYQPGFFERSIGIQPDHGSEKTVMDWANNNASANRTALSETKEP